MDGYIATENHELDWLYDCPPGDDATPYNAFYQNIGVTIMGAGTYEWIIKNAAAKGKDVWVIGGGKTAASFADAGELQQLFITTIQVVLGSGLPVLPVSQTVYVTPNKQRCLRNGAIETIMDITVTK
ncbi:hypothetical protein PSI15_05620 [Xenorhabdus sp. PR6a]|uniref:dihydrofolate reductase family protein n=1 Tax=Xenorhabdus sp. PR6a TaxID=3025877 RepID=UPI002358F97E|nr:hypothetical protein [Xenorhabdus sp. PR6a]MDC9581056.1 hypothetical protein [Xenorhabdus sp. PR6a]